MTWPRSVSFSTFGSFSHISRAADFRNALLLMRYEIVEEPLAYRIVLPKIELFLGHIGPGVA
jgi:hypothetical protein